MSEESSKTSKNNGRPRRRRRPSGARNNKDKTSQQAQGEVKKKGNRKRRSRTNKGPKGPRLSDLDRLIVKYENLREQHIEARRKYYDLFERADPQQKDKLERVFTNTMKKVREFEQNLKPEDKKLFDQHYNGLKPDLIYSENHQLRPEGELSPTADETREDPHYLESQKECDFSQDTEESMGTLEDYQAYKGL